MVFFGCDQQTFSLEVLERVILDTRFGKFSLKFGHCFGLCCGCCFGLCCGHCCGHRCGLCFRALLGFWDCFAFLLS